MKLWLGTGNGTLPGKVLLPPDDAPGVENLKKVIKKKVEIKKDPTEKKNSLEKKAEKEIQKKK